MSPRIPDRGVVSLLWRAEAGAAEYRLVISSRSDLSRPVVRRKLDRPSAKVMGLPGGKYYWRVESLAADDGVQATSRIGTFSITRGSP